MNSDDNQMTLGIKIESRDKTEKYAEEDWEIIKKEVYSVIESLPTEVNNISKILYPKEEQIKIETEITYIKDGSITLAVLIPIAIGTFTVISQLDSFITGVKIITEACRSKLHSSLNKKDTVDVTINIQVIEVYFADKDKKNYEDNPIPSFGNINGGIPEKGKRKKTIG